MASENEKEITLSLNKNTITYVLVGLLIVASFAIGMLWTKVQNLEGTGSNTGKVEVANNGVPAAANANDVPGITDEDHIRGNRDAKIAVIEYSDFECPFCKRHHPTLEKVLEEYGDEVMWVYRQFPLPQLHKNAQKLAEASECAGKLGGNDKFWEATDELFNDTYTQDEEDIKTLASRIGLNGDELWNCVDSGEMAATVKAQADGGSKAGVAGTPGNVILNIETGEAKLVSGAQPFENISAVIDTLMNN